MEWNLDKVDFEMVEILVIVEKTDFKFFWMKFLDTLQGRWSLMRKGAHLRTHSLSLI